MLTRWLRQPQWRGTPPRRSPGIRRGGCALALLGILAAPPGRAEAQTEPEPAAEAMFLVGPLDLTPTFAVSDIGYDSNVFNTAGEPVGDFTTTITPGLRGGIQLGPGRVRFETGVGLVFFREQRSQGSVNFDQRVEVEAPLGRVRPFGEVRWLDTRVRAGYEIDARARRHEPTLLAGAEFRVTDVTSFVVSARRTRTRYDEGERFLDVDLDRALNRDTNVTAMAFKVTMTPLTTFVAESQVERTRFELDPGRDNTGLRFWGGFDFKPDALLWGTARVGYRALSGRDDRVPEFRGLAAAVELGYAHPGGTRLSGQISRDVEYSLEDLAPYYVATGWRVSAVQRIAGPVDVTATLGRQALDYRGLVDAGEASRADRVHTVGAGVGYRFGETVRVGLNVERSDRNSPVFHRTYDRTRVFASVTLENP